MKNFLFLILSVVFIFSSVSCKKNVDHNYPTTFVYNNPTSHAIEIKIESNYTPMEFTLAPGENFSKIWVIGFGPVPIDLTKADIMFDGKYHVVHNGIETESKYHNICDIDNYVKSDDPEIEHGRVLTFTFTEADYEYAVSSEDSEQN